MKNQFKEELWIPVVPEHPESSKVYRRSEPHSFVQYQPLSERYEVPGLMPKAPESPKKDFLATALENCQKFNEEFEGTFDKS